MSGLKSARARRAWTILWTVIATLLAAGVLFVASRRLDPGRLLEVVRGADWPWLIVLTLALPAEQVLRAWKWRQILHDLKPVSTWRLFGAVMAGYFANMVVSVGVSPLVRAWLVARLEHLAFATVLLTTAIERFVDGIVFAILVGLMITGSAGLVVEGDLRLGFLIAGAGSLTLFGGLMLLLFRLRASLDRPNALAARALARIERWFGGRLVGLNAAVAAGILWPSQRWRGVGVVLASITMKLLSTAHFFWAGLALGLVFQPIDYLFVMVVTSFAMILTRFVRIPGGAVIGSALALQAIGAPDEEALAMVAMVHVGSMLTTVAIGAIALWRGGTSLAALRAATAAGDG